MRRLAGIILGTLLLSGWVTPSNAKKAVVHAVLFYSDSCPHCHQVITEDLPPLEEKYGDQLQILTINTSTEEGLSLYLAAVEQFNIPPERQGVPTMILGNVVMVGSVEIPEQLPLLIENGLKEGGVPWPDIEGLSAIITSDGPGTAQSQVGVIEKIMRDPLGNGISIAVLVFMVFVFVLEIARAPWKTTAQKVKNPRKAWRKWSIPILCIIGLVVAGYLAYVEMNAIPAVCGPVGDCNTVQTSEYAFIFGILSVGLFGVMGYLVILGVWLFKEYGGKNLAQMASTGLMLLTTFGILFSIYLTFLEPFVIGATCSWCLTSALLMTALFWVSFETSRDMVRTKPHRHAHGGHSVRS